MTEYSKNPEEAKQISHQIYSSDFCHLIRTSIHELKHVRCPMTEAQLQKLGIDLAGISGNTISTKNNNRPADCMRYHNKTFTERNTMQRNKRPNRRDQPERGGKAWKAKKNTKEINDEDEAKCQKEVRGLLNKMTPSTFEVMVRQFCDLKVHTDPKLLPIITTLIFEKAVEDQMFCPLYSDLCLKQVELESKLDAEQRPPISFSSSIIKKCQETFLCAIRSDDLIKQLEKERATETTEDSKKSVTEKIDLLKTKKKRTLLGIIQFIAQLYRYNLLIDWIINWCVSLIFFSLTENTDEVYIEYAVKMIETVGPTYHKKRLLAQKQSMAAAADAEVPYIEKIVAQLCSIKSSLTNKLKFMIMNLDELRKNNWQTKHDSRRLTTLENREDDTEQEERQNKKDRYNRKTSHYGNKKGSSFNYPGSAFIDDNNSILAPQSTDRRAADAGASSQTGTASVREGTNLIKVNDGRLGRLPNIWKSYGAVPTASVTSPSNADSTTKKTSPPQ
uniref:MIF4G domain-containing protein n=1 Tax=Ditylenchus dipsaci TaxID=166011 RepID=A0A915EIP8_9BILA